MKFANIVAKVLFANVSSLDAESAYPGVTGPIRFLENGDPVGKSLVMTRVHLGSLLVERRR